MECDHCGLFDPVCNIGRDVAVIIVLFFLLTLASAGGIGGGGIIIPMLLLIGDFPTYYSVPLSVTAIFGGSIVRFVMLVMRDHPNASVKRNLIDFRIVLLMLPMALAGTTIGVLVNTVSPNWLVISVIFVTLTYVSYRTVKKGIQLHKKEKEANLRAAKAAAGDGIELDIVSGLSEAANPADSSTSTDGPAKAPNLDNVLELEEIYAEEARFPWKYIVITFSELIVIVILNLVKGGSSGASFAGVECGTGAYGGIIAAQWVFLVACSASAAVWIRKGYLRKVALGYNFVEGDVHYTSYTVKVYPALAITVGFLAGFLGIGGGMVLGPLLLALQMHPMVSMATTSYMTLFTSCSSFAQYAVLNRVIWSYGGLLFGVALVASWAGQYFFVGYIRRTGKNSLIAFILAGIIILATILLCALGIVNIIDDVNNGDTGFTGICD